MTSSPESSISTTAPSAPRCICRSVGRRTPATATEKVASKCWMSFQNGNLSTLITRGSSKGRRLTKTDPRRHCEERSDEAIPFKWRRGLLVFAVVFVLQSTATEAAAPRTIQINADVVTARDGGQTLEARGHVVITDGRLTIRADLVHYDRTSRQIRLSGNVRIATPQGDLAAGEAAAQLTKEGALAALQASMGVNLQSAGRTLKANRVAHQAKDDTLTATGDLGGTFPPDLVATGGALVAKGTDVVTVTGRPRIRNRDGFLEGDRLGGGAHTQTAPVRGHGVRGFEETRLTAGTAAL